jgi:hypothetical protein
MTQPNSTSDAMKPLRVSDKLAFARTQREIQNLEADGITYFQMFNAMADLFHQEKQPELSRLMAEAAYHCYQQDYD